MTDETRRASIFFLLALAACGRPPKSTPPAPPSIAMPSDAGASAVATPCPHPTCVTQSVIDITPWGTSNVAAVGDDVWFLRSRDPALLKRGAADKQDVVLAEDVHVKPDTSMSQMLVENDIAYFVTSHGVTSWNRKTSALTALTKNGELDVAGRIAIDQTHVYFVASDCRYVNGQKNNCVSFCVVGRVLKSGGKVEELTAVALPPDMSEEYPMLTVDETSVWFTPGVTGKIYSVSKAKEKGPRKAVFSKNEPVWGLTDDADNVYAIAGDGSHAKLYRIPKKAGPAAVMREEIVVGSYHSLESDASQLYFFDVEKQERVLAALPKSGGARRVLQSFNENEDPITIVPAPSSVSVVVFHRSETPEENQAYLWRIGK